MVMYNKRSNSIIAIQPVHNSFINTLSVDASPVVKTFSHSDWSGAHVLRKLAITTLFFRSLHNNCSFTFCLVQTNTIP